MLDQARSHDPKNPSVFRAVANFYREQHDYKAAIAALKSAPGQSVELLADLGYSYELDGDSRGAAETYSKAANLAPRQIGLQLSAAQAELRFGETDHAQTFLARAAQIDANHYRLHALKAQLARMQKRNAEAIREYKTAIANLPNAAVPEGQLYPIELRLNLAEIYRQTGDDAAAQQQIADAETLVNQLHIEGAARAEFLRVRASIRLGGNDLQGAESDLNEALKLDPNNTTLILQYANLLWHMKRTEESRRLYAEVLKADPKNRYALEAMGYIARDENDNAAAEGYFNQLAADYPDDYVAYLALGDLFTSTMQFDRAIASYEEAFKRAPRNPTVVANAANAAIQAGRISIAADWIERATGTMLDDPRLMRERERVLFHQGKYAESARLGYQVLTQLETDRNASVYLAYDLYNLGRYDETLTITTRYTKLLPKEANFPLLTGHVHKQSQLLQQAVEDYTEAYQARSEDGGGLRKSWLCAQRSAKSGRRNSRLSHRARPAAFQRCRPPRPCVLRAAASSRARCAGRGRQSREAARRVRRDSPGARHRVSRHATPRQGGAGIRCDAEVCARRSEAPSRAGRHSISRAALSGRNPDPERGACDLSR